MNNIKQLSHGSWLAMIDRCYNPNHTRYARYGGRGITVCDQWKNSYDQFIEDMGEKPSPSHSIERIDNDGNYEPSNCKWATPTEQANNKQNNRILEYNGESKTIAQWSRHTGVIEVNIRMRIDKNGWSVAQALGYEEPPIKGRNAHKRMIEYNGVSKSLSEWASYLNIERSSLRERLEKWSVGQALGFEEPPNANLRLLEFDGETKTLTEWAKEYNIGKTTLSYRLKSGWSLGRALTGNDDKDTIKPRKKSNYIPDNTPRNIEYNGKSKSLGEWSKELGIPRLTLKKRIDNLGWSIEEAFTKPTQYRPRKI